MLGQWELMELISEHIVGVVSSGDLTQPQRASYQKDLALITSLLEQHNKIEAVQKEINDIAEQMTQTDDQEMQELFKEELEQLNQQKQQEARALDDQLYPPDGHDDRNVYVEIRAGAGGQEAALFATDLLKLYKLYAEKKAGAYRWKV